MEKFCALPAETKKILPCSNNAAGVGYELKEGGGADIKENFDVTMGGLEWLLKNAEKAENPAVTDFIHQATSLVALMKPSVLDFSRQAEKAFDLRGFADEVDRSEGEFFVRFIHYFGNRDAGDEIASPHVDQSCFTLHLYESDPGLQGLTYSDRKWINMPVSSGETVIIPSMQMQLRSKGSLKALWHRVIATHHTAEHGRFSAVCFVQLVDSPTRDKEKTGRMQEWPKGSTYDSSHEEFTRFFKART